MSNVSTLVPTDEWLSALEFTTGTAWRCAMTGYYFDEVSAHPSGDQFWISVQNSLGESFCLLWCHLFGSRDDDLHYSQIFSHPEISRLGPEFEVVSVKARLCESVAIDEPAYASLWQEMRRCRDKFIAHREIDAIVNFPRTDLCLQLVEGLRTILADGANKLHDLHPDNSRIESLHRFCKEKTNEYVRRAAHLQFVTGLRSGTEWVANIVARHAGGNSLSDHPVATEQ